MLERDKATFMVIPHGVKDPVIFMHFIGQIKYHFYEWNPISAILQMEFHSLDETQKYSKYMINSNQLIFELFITGKVKKITPFVTRCNKNNPV